MHAVSANPLGILVFIFGKIIWLLRLCLLAYLCALCVTLYSGYSQFLVLDRFVWWVDRIARPAQNLLRENLPTIVGGLDMTPMLLVILGMATMRLDSRWEQWRMDVALWKKSIRYKRQLSRVRLAARKQATKIQALPTTPEPSGREELLELYARTKKALEDQKQLLSFLSINVVGSPRMKEHEDAAIATRDFSRYKALVEEILDRYEYLKASWTPDGVMVCFRETAQAVSAGHDVLRSLSHLNREIKAMSTDFKVRVGINSDQVLYDDAVLMEEMSDRVIDIAGHMQKYADENSIFINKYAVRDDIFLSGFVPANTEVDGCEVLIWKCV
jgi:uncharacterized protein YggT (Ycf19 family)